MARKLEEEYINAGPSITMRTCKYAVLGKEDIDNLPIDDRAETRRVARSVKFTRKIKSVLKRR